MIFSMPVISFLIFLAPAGLWVILAIIVYQVMKKQDSKIDDAEFTTVYRGGVHD